MTNILIDPKYIIDKIERENGRMGNSMEDLIELLKSLMQVHKKKPQIFEKKILVTLLLF